MYSAGSTASVSSVALIRSADDDGRKRLLHLGAGARGQGHRHEAKRGDQRGHHDRAGTASARPPRSPLRAACLLAQLADELSITSPLSTATPDSAIKPTAAEIENGMPRSHSARTPPVQRQRHRAEHQQRVARRAHRASSSRKIMHEADRHDDGEALAGGRQVFGLTAPRHPVARRQLHVARRSRCCASSTTEPRSRPRTLAVTTMRRLPFSRLIWFGLRRRRISRRD